MTIIGIDPGTTQSGYVQLGEDGIARFPAVLPNEQILDTMRCLSVNIPVAIEMIENQGRMAVGADTFETCVWIGRFTEAAHPGHVERIGRRDIKLLLCGTARAKDSDIRAFLIDLYGGKEAAIGRKAAPGPLYGVKAHAWQALAVAVAYRMQQDPAWKPGEARQ